MQIDFELLIWLLVPILVLSLLVVIYTYEESISVKVAELGNFLSKIDTTMFGGRLFPALVFITNWAVPVLYLVLYALLVIFFYTRLFPKIIRPNTTIYNTVLCLLLLTFFTAIFKTPEYVESHNVNQHTTRFNNDKLIFFDDQVCKTCKLIKPARSKHCKVCGRCVVYFDHHCIWINNCVGGGNFGWFYGFLLLNVISITYGIAITIQIIFELQREVGFKIFKVSYYPNEFAFILILVMLDLVLIWFLGVHLDFTSRGMTTNEADKWGDVHYLVELGTLYLSPHDGEYYEYLTREDVFVGLNVRDNRVKNVDRKALCKVSSVDELVNIYDKGIWENLKERLID